MSPEAFDKFCGDIGISSEDIVTLMLLYKLNAQEMYVLDRKAFVEGFKGLGYGNFGPFFNY